MAMRAAGRGPARWFDNLGMVRKMLLPVGLAVACMLVVGVTGWTGIASLENATRQLDDDGVHPLKSLGSIRDAEGDSRLAVRKYLEVTDAKGLTEAKARVREADDYMTTALSEYQAGHNLDAPRAALLQKFTTAFTHWQQLRDGTVLRLVDAGRIADAAKATGALDAADDGPTGFAGPLDELSDAEFANAHVVADRANASATSARRQLLLIVIAGLLLPGALAVWGARRTASGLRHVGDVLDGVAAGRLTEQAHLSSTDEIGRMAERLNRTTGAFRGSVTAILDNAASLTVNADQLAAVSDRLSTATNRASAQTDTVAAATDVVSSNVTAAASGAEQMRAAIGQIAESAASAATVTAQAVASARQASAAITALGESSTEIGTIVKVITSIAEQTNLLALNATIEAARAGESGKGFAVVANEVKELAQETAKATKDIATRVQALQRDSVGAAEAITEIDAVISQVNDAQATIASAVEEQTATTAQISHNVTETATGTEQITTAVALLRETMTGVDTGAAQTAESAGQLNRMSRDLHDVTSTFQV
ncbi:MAG: methyl-accepting chemotaxis protein [Mycobacteriales bacterium]